MKTVVALFLVFALALTLAPAAFAENMTTSEDMVWMIKNEEGFRSKAYSCGGGWYIGYGLSCKRGQYPNGISETKADGLLRERIAQYENIVNTFAAENNLTLTQGQFDALLDLTYNMGGAWMSKTSYRLTSYLLDGIENHTDMEFASAICAFCHVGKKVSSALLARRMRDASAFVYGEYAFSGETAHTLCLLETDVAVGEYKVKIFCATLGEPYGILPVPEGKGYFAGWAKPDGTILSPNELCTGNLEVTATWSDTPVELEKFVPIIQDIDGSAVSLLTGTFADPAPAEACAAALAFSSENDILKSEDETLLFALSGTEFSLSEENESSTIEIPDPAEVLRQSLPQVVSETVATLTQFGRIIEE